MIEIDISDNAPLSNNSFAYKIFKQHIKYLHINNLYCYIKLNNVN